jgi:DNA processing protein
MNSVPAEAIRQVLDTAEDYPKALRELADRPPVLYITGRWPLPETCRIGIVGTRHPSVYGLEATQRLTTELVRRNVMTVSGLAAGIDARAHRATMDAGGWTVAILGHGLGFQYPKENGPLFEKIAKEGTLISEFSYDTGPHSEHFPRRNRIISGLSRGVLVVEAGHRSGAGITARYAAEQGKDVFVVPGSIFSPQSVGCHRLIKEGAQLTTSAEDILEEYGLVPHDVIPADCQPGSSGVNIDVIGSRITDFRDDNLEGLTTPEKELLQRLSVEPVSVDELVELSGWPVDRLAEVLLSLEIKGKIRHLPGQRYHRYDSPEW